MKKCRLLINIYVSKEDSQYFQKKKEIEEYAARVIMQYFKTSPIEVQAIEYKDTDVKAIKKLIKEWK